MSHLPRVDHRDQSFNTATVIGFIKNELVPMRPKMFLPTDLQGIGSMLLANFVMADHSDRVVPRYAYFTRQSAAKMFSPTDPQ